MDPNPERSPVSYVVQVSRLPRTGLAVSIEANADEREALARVHSVDSVASFRAALQVTPWKRNGVKVEGTVEADIVQSCVVTLEPLAGTIRERVEGVFLPADSKLGRQGFDAGGEMLLDAEGPDGPEIFEGDSIDVGALAEEFFGLAIDPYPRRAGVSMAEAQARPEPAAGPEGPLQQALRRLADKG
jgi:hypothetical protein